MRVFELAKTVGVSTKDLTALLGKLHIKAPTHMSSLNEEAVAKVKAALKKPAKSVKLVLPVIKSAPPIAKPAAPIPKPSHQL